MGEACKVAGGKRFDPAQQQTGVVALNFLFGHLGRFHRTT